MIFKDRTQAGALLAKKLSSYRGKPAVVVGLARGGLEVASQIAKILTLPLDILVVKKLPSPHDPELAIGALAPDGISFVDWKLASIVGVDDVYIQSQIDYLFSQIKQKAQLYRKVKKPAKLEGKTVILVDDGIATGATMRAAIKWLHAKSVLRIVLALPVAPKQFIETVRSSVYQAVILQEPEDLGSVGQYYEHFEQVDDKRVIELLKKRY